MKKFASIFVLLSLLACGHNSDSQSPSNLPITHMTIGGKDFSLEIATSEHDQTVGLMHRDHMDSDHGMLFVFPDMQKRYFWNHDVHFPLDLIFVDNTGTVVSLKRMEAYNENNTGSDFPAEYAIELNAGTAAKVGLAVGAHLDIPTDAKAR